MLLVVEVSEETQAVELVVRIGVVQLLQELQLLQPCFLPAEENNKTIEDQNNPLKPELLFFFKRKHFQGQFKFKMSWMRLLLPGGLT